MGAVFGFVVGLTSVGSGTFFGLMMVLVYPLTMAKIVGTDIFHAAALLWVAGVGHLVAGNVDLHATAWLLLGSIPGILISSKFTVKVPDIGLRVALGTILMLSGLKLLNVPEVELDPRRRPRPPSRSRGRVRPARLAGAAAPRRQGASSRAVPRGEPEVPDVQSPGFAAASLDGDACSACSSPRPRPSPSPRS